jgi:hypothetical protein
MASNPATVAGAASILGKDIMDIFKGKIGSAWESFSERDKALAERAAKRFAQLTFKKMTGADVEEDIMVVEATLANLSYIETERALKVFWETANETVGVAASFLRGVIAGHLS